MHILLSLLAIVQALLIQLGVTPNVSPPVRTQVIQVAGDAINAVLPATMPTPQSLGTSTATDTPVSTSSPVVVQPVQPIIIYVQTTPEPSASVPNPAPTSQPIAMQPSGPAPVIKSVSFTKDDTQTTATWETDIASKTEFFLADQPTPGDDLGNYVSQTIIDTDGTNFSYKFDTILRPIFYAVKVTANGNTVVKKGQVLAMPVQQ